MRTWLTSGVSPRSLALAARGCRPRYRIARAPSPRALAPSHSRPRRPRPRRARPVLALRPRRARLAPASRPCRARPCLHPRSAPAPAPAPTPSSCPRPRPAPTPRPRRPPRAHPPAPSCILAHVPTPPPPPCSLPGKFSAWEKAIRTGAPRAIGARFLKHLEIGAKRFGGGCSVLFGKTKPKRPRLQSLTRACFSKRSPRLSSESRRLVRGVEEAEHAFRSVAPRFGL